MHVLILELQCVEKNKDCTFKTKDGGIVNELSLKIRK